MYPAEYIFYFNGKEKVCRCVCEGRNENGNRCYNNHKTHNKHTFRDSLLTKCNGKIYYYLPFSLGGVSLKEQVNDKIVLDVVIVTKQLGLDVEKMRKAIKG